MDIVLSTEEAKRLFDSEARRQLGISGEDFVQKWEAGEYEDPPDTPEGWPAMRVAFLLPLVRQVRG
jgi:hypothetical protein